jgi:hypothetical protein
MSFFKDYEPAVNTAKDFSDKFGPNRDSVPLLLELDLAATDSFIDGASLQDVLERFTRQGWKEVRIWTRDTTKLVHENWPTGLMDPFDDEFSYGGSVVKTLALARLAGCEYQVRTDPGCSAPQDLLGTIQRHIVPIKKGYVDVVSGCNYDNRWAIRIDFLPQDPQEIHHEFRQEFFRLVEAFTNIVPENQITGGPLYTCRVQGPPPPSFGAVKPVAIVLSDDGFMKTVLGDRAIIDGNTVVPRSQPGFPLSSHNYRVRLSLMAALDHLWRGKTTSGAATAAGAFYRAIGALVAESRRADVDVAAAKTAIENQIHLIARGIERYHALLMGRWTDCLEVVASHDSLAQVTKAA